LVKSGPFEKALPSGRAFYFCFPYPEEQMESGMLKVGVGCISCPIDLS
jgi:hypothetical protein